MAKGIPDNWKKDSYGNNVFTLNVKCPMPIKKHNVLYFSLITQNLEETPLNISLVSFRYIGVILCDYFYNVQCIQ